MHGKACKIRAVCSASVRLGEGVMSGAKSKKRDRGAKASYRLSKTRRAVIARARTSGRVDPFAAPEFSSGARRNKAGAS